MVVRRIRLPASLRFELYLLDCRHFFVTFDLANVQMRLPLRWFTRSLDKHAQPSSVDPSAQFDALLDGNRNSRSAIVIVDTQVGAAQH